MNNITKMVLTFEDGSEMSVTGDPFVDPMGIPILVSNFDESQRVIAETGVIPGEAQLESGLQLVDSFTVGTVPDGTPVPSQDVVTDTFGTLAAPADTTAAPVDAATAPVDAQAAPAATPVAPTESAPGAKSVVTVTITAEDLAAHQSLVDAGFTEGQVVEVEEVPQGTSPMEHLAQTAPTA